MFKNSAKTLMCVYFIEISPRMSRITACMSGARANGFGTWKGGVHPTPLLNPSLSTPAGRAN